MHVELIDSMGDDLRAVNAARVSYDVWKQEWDNRDKSLVDYLGREAHWSPFTHCVASFRITANLAVAAQLWKSHIGLIWTPGWNQVSRRYVDKPPTFDLPKVWRGRPQRGQSKQGSSGPVDYQAYIAGLVRFAVQVAADTYNDLIDGGVAPEQARLVLPMATETSWIWTGSLYAFIRVCSERLAPDAQQETREVAEQIYQHLCRIFPHSMTAWGLNSEQDKEME